MNIRIATHCTLTGLLAVLLSRAAFATPPAAPVVTAGAGPKQLQFDWNYVPRASHYEVWFRSNPGAAWAKFADTPTWRPRANVNISAHLLHWVEARYVIKACNPSGCTSSPEISVSGLMRDSVGYFKASTPASTGPQNLGRDVAMSEEGSTIAAGAGHGIDGAVVVFRKNSTRWVEEAQLLPSVVNQERGGSSTSTLDISGDGSVIVLGAPEEVRPETDAGEFPEIGAVYVFRRTSSGWAQEQRLASANSQAEDAFGRYVDLDESGTLLAVSRRWGEGSPPGGFSSQGPVEIYRHTSSGWVPLVTIPAVNDRCYAMRLSGDGRTLIRSCAGHVDAFTAPDWQRVASLPSPLDGMIQGQSESSVAVSYDGRNFAVRSIKMEDDGSTFHTSVAIYRQNGSGWSRETNLAPGDWTRPGETDFPTAAYGLQLSMSRDGRFLAVGSVRDPADGTGVLYPPIVNNNNGTSGAVYVYERRPAGWHLRQFIKPNSETWQFVAFGAAVSLARNGKDLAVGAPGDSSSATGIDGNQSDTSAPGRGAVWLY